MIEQLVPSEICVGCQGCCRFVDRGTAWAPALLKEEIAHASMRCIPPALIGQDYKIILQPSENGSLFLCPCLDEGSNKCKVYHCRPFECQLYPFVLKKKKAQIFLAADPNCPFVHEQKDTPAFQEYAVRMSKHLGTVSSKKMLRENRHLIQEYEGVVELAELFL